MGFGGEDTIIMTRISISEAKDMRENGYTYSEIGKHFGCSKQRIHQILHSKKATGEDNFNKFVYKNILSWCRNNEIYTIGKLARALGLDCSNATLTNKLEGKNDFTLSEIKKILNATGMDFDFCFLCDSD